MLLIQTLLPHMGVKVIHLKHVKIKDKQGAETTVIIEYHLKLDLDIRKVLQVVEVSLK